MKKNRFSTAARITASTPFLILGLCFFVFAFSNLSARNRFRHASNLSQTSPAVSVPEQFSGTFDPAVYPCGTARHHFMVPADQLRIVVQADAELPTNDITVTLLYGPDPDPIFIQTEDTGVGSEVLVYEPPGGLLPGEYQVQICQAGNAATSMAPYDYTGIFTYDNTGTAGVPTPPFGPIPPATLDNGPKVGFENFTAPGDLLRVTTTEGGQQPNSVEYMGRNAGEPSIGNNWLSDTTIFYSGLETLFVKFDDTCPLSGLSSTWVNRAAPTQVAVDSDPIGFTDSPLGRSFAGELTLLSPTCKTSYTDDDGQTWVPTQGSGLASGVDHETIGGGRYHDPIPTLPTPYNHAVYYCSQEGVPGGGPPSFCSRSDDGGLTFGPSVPLTSPPINVCGGLHGHVKVSPNDGTVYVPFNTCGGVGSVIVSEDNGITWTIRHAQTDTVAMQPSASFQDPAIGIDANGRVYYVIANNDTAAAVLTSDDHGATWQNLADVAAVYGLQNIRYPAAVGGDAGRAAVAFYGTTTAGDALQGSFQGVWHLYVATTFDGGLTWSTTDVTPNAPMQRGCIWAKGGANICRNLLDFFDMTADKDGRILVGYVNGCEGGNCVQAPVTAQGETLPMQGNAYTSTATIARQSSGRRMFAAGDPASMTSKPGTPSLTQRRVGNIVHLQWSEADTGNLMINNYQIIRRSDTSAPAVLATVSGGQTGGTYDDTLANDDTTAYYYRVVAVNSAGSSCDNNEVAAPYLGTPCTGMIIHRNDPTHPEANSGTATPPSLLIDYIAVGEPPNTDDFMFKMKVNDLSTLPPNSRWRIVWDSFSSPGQQYYIGMRTDENAVPSFQYGYLADAGVPAVFVISEQNAIPADPASNYQPDGTITIYAPKSAFGNPQPGTLLGAVNGRTFTGDTPDTGTYHRSNAFVDHTFVKAQTDNSYPASTYLVTGNNFCSGTGIAPIGAVSRKTHGSAGDFSIDLPLSGSPGIESRSGNHQVLITFPGPVSFDSATCGGQPATSASANGSVVTVDCPDMSNAQVVAITLTGVNDGANVGNVSLPMGLLLGDVDGNGIVSNTDVAFVKSQVSSSVTGSNFRADVNANGVISNTDVAITKTQVSNTLP